MKTKVDTQFTRRKLLGAAGAVSALALAGALPRVALGQASPVAEVAPYDGEEVTITYGFWDTAQEAAINAQLEAFKAHFPNITVEPQIVPWADYWTKLQTGIAGGETFDVFWINSASLPVYASAGALLPIDSIVGEGGVDIANFAAPLVEMYQWDGLQYGIPRDFDTIALFYNKDIFDAAGVAYPDDTWTWETFRATGEQLTDSGAGIWGAGLQTSWQENYYNFIYQNGGRLLNDDLTQSEVGSPEASEAFVYLAGFFADELTPSI
ncbi:MAG: sugar ABC transporter substrate-binding protein, partial [Thermomicrobiales bacterium]|nr:sugar ABC transporter substrate-binding protein [Thermomicrobiales bacterium]